MRLASHAAVRRAAVLAWALVGAVGCAAPDAAEDSAPLTYRPGDGEQAGGEAYTLDPRNRPPEGPVLRGVAEALAKTPSGEAAGRPVLVFMLEADRLYAPRADERAALREGFGGAEYVVVAEVAPRRTDTTVATLREAAREAEARTVALVQFRGVGRGRSASVALFDVESGALAALDAGILPSLQALGAVIAKRTA